MCGGTRKERALLQHRLRPFPAMTDSRTTRSRLRTTHAPRTGAATDSPLPSPRSQLASVRHRDRRAQALCCGAQRSRARHRNCACVRHGLLAPTCSWRGRQRGRPANGHHREIRCATGSKGHANAFGCEATALPTHPRPTIFAADNRPVAYRLSPPPGPPPATHAFPRPHPTVAAARRAGCAVGPHPSPRRLDRRRGAACRAADRRAAAAARRLSPPSCCFRDGRRGRRRAARRAARRCRNRPCPWWAWRAWRPRWLRPWRRQRRQHPQQARRRRRRPPSTPTPRAGCSSVAKPARAADTPHQHPPVHHVPHTGPPANGALW